MKKRDPSDGRICFIETEKRDGVYYINESFDYVLDLLGVKDKLVVVNLSEHYNYLFIASFIPAFEDRKPLIIFTEYIRTFLNEGTIKPSGSVRYFMRLNEDGSIVRYNEGRTTQQELRISMY